MLEFLFVRHCRSWFGLGRFSCVVSSVEHPLSLCSGHHGHVCLHRVMCYIPRCTNSSPSINGMIHKLCVYTLFGIWLNWIEPKIVAHIRVRDFERVINDVAFVIKMRI